LPTSFNEPYSREFIHGIPNIGSSNVKGKRGGENVKNRKRDGSVGIVSTLRCNGKKENIRSMMLCMI